MKALWMLLKVVLVLVLIVPLGIIAAATALGILGALVGVAIFALRIALVGLILVGAFKLLGHLLGREGPARTKATVPARELPPRDPHYEAAMRELDRELGTSQTSG